MIRVEKKEYNGLPARMKKCPVCKDRDKAILIELNEDTFFIICNECAKELKDKL